MNNLKHTRSLAARLRGGCQLSLPVNRRPQFAGKWGVALALALLFGFGMPALLEASRVSAIYHNRWTMLGLIGIALAALRLAFWNFQRIDLGRKVVVRNVFVLIATLVLVATTTTAVYHQVWEKLTPFEPAHGPAKLSLSQPAVLHSFFKTLFVQLPDGRVWTDDYRFGIDTWLHDHHLDSVGSLHLGATWMNPLKITSLDGHFYAGSNWVSINRSAAWSIRAGIKSDGTLWVSDVLMHPCSLDCLINRKTGNRVDRLVKANDEDDWRSVVTVGDALLLVRRDGTLWRWGSPEDSFKHKKWPGLLSFTPDQMGTDSDWEDVFEASYQIYFRKTDGRLFTSVVSKPGMVAVTGPRFGPHPLPARTQWNGTMIGTRRATYQVGITDDGNLVIWLAQEWNGKQPVFDLTKTNAFHLASGTNWLAVAQAGWDYTKMITLKKDGTLWLWSFPDAHSEQELLTTKPVRLGIHSDWVGMSDANGEVISLAADGSLWYWPLESAEDVSGDRHSNGPDFFAPLLDISRTPQRLANIFESH